MKNYAPRPRVPARKKYHMCDISGQCRTCLDLFSLTVSLHDGVPIITDTARVRWMYHPETKRDRLIHRPDVCNGEINLYGSLESLPHHPSTANYVFPSAAAATNARSQLDASRH